MEQHKNQCCSELPGTFLYGVFSRAISLGSSDSSSMYSIEAVACLLALRHLPKFQNFVRFQKVQNQNVFHEIPCQQWTTDQNFISQN